MNENITMPDPEGRELNLREHVTQSTLAHPLWHELDHMHYLIHEVGFDGQYARDHMEDIIQQMIITRSEEIEKLRAAGLGPFPLTS